MVARERVIAYLRSVLEIGHGTGRQIAAMEGIRGLAVFLVFLVHYVSMTEPWLRPGTAMWNLARVIHSAGNAGVDLFFVLSGYLIYGTLIRKPRPMLAYFRRRIERIYPAFLAVFIVYVVLSFVFPGENKIPTGSLSAATTYLLANLLLLPGLFPIEPMITVSWSLSYEAFYYLCIPWLIGALGLRQWTSLGRLWFFAGASACIIGYGALVGFPHVRLVMFIAGIMLFEIVGNHAPPRIDRLGVLALVLGLMLASQFEGATRIAVLFVSLALLCYAAFQGDGLARRWFSMTPIRWLGNMSYSYYLIHGLSLKAMFMLLATKIRPTGNWDGIEFFGVLPFAFALTLIPSFMLFVMVERPISLAPRKNKAVLRSRSDDLCR